MSGLIRKSMLAGLLAAALSAGCLSAMAQEKAASAPPKLKVGDPAPEFTLRYFDGNDLKDVHLSDYRGKKNVVLAFYIFAFTGG